MGFIHFNVSKFRKRSRKNLSKDKIHCLIPQDTRSTGSFCNLCDKVFCSFQTKPYEYTQVMYRLSYTRVLKCTHIHVLLTVSTSMQVPNSLWFLISQSRVRNPGCIATCKIASEHPRKLLLPHFLSKWQGFHDGWIFILGFHTNINKEDNIRDCIVPASRLHSYNQRPELKLLSRLELKPARYSAPSIQQCKYACIYIYAA